MNLEKEVETLKNESKMDTQEFIEYECINPTSSGLTLALPVRAKYFQKTTKEHSKVLT